MNRLKYETKGGSFSEADTFSQMIEYLRLASEASYMIGHHRKENNDLVTGQGFLVVGEMLEMTLINVTKLATGKLKLQ